MVEKQSSVVSRHILVLPALRAEQKTVKDKKKKKRQKQESDSLAIRKGYSWIQKAWLDVQFHWQHCLLQGQPKSLIKRFILIFASNQELFLPSASCHTFQNPKSLLIKSQVLST